MHVLAVLGAEARHHEGARADAHLVRVGVGVGLVRQVHPTPNPTHQGASADAHLLHRQVHLVRVRVRVRIKVRVRVRVRARASKPR